MLPDTDAAATARPPEYPRREPFFALRFLRLIDALRLSAEIGENAVALLKVIAVQEDAKRYRSPVTYFNDALLRTLNFAKEERLNDARKKAVSAGWLHYGFRGNRKAGEYWVTIPEAYQSIKDECADDSCIVPDPYQEGYQAGFRAAMAQRASEISDSQSTTPEQTTPARKGIDEGCNQGGNVGCVQGVNVGGPSSCNHIQNQLPEEHTPAETEKPGLREFCEAWNSWHDAGIVSQRIRNAQKPGKTITDAWRRAQRVPEQRDRLRDLPAIQEAIQSSQEMLVPAAWFDAAGLLSGKNSNHRYYSEMLLKGQYRDRSTNSKGDYRATHQPNTAIAKEQRISDAFDIVLSSAANCRSGDC